jgi:DNA-binding NarL/FixJ family response regulator
MPIRIFIYDDSKQRRDSLIELIALSDNFVFVGEAENCKNVMQEMETYYPEVVLMDSNMPIVDGLEGLRKIKATFPNVQVLMQTAFDDSDKIFTSIQNGASGYILKSDSANKILQAIQEVYEGGVVMNPTIAKKVLDYFTPSKKDNPLSTKENVVLMHLSQGLSYKMIANEMGISYTTVNFHVKSIYAKLHINSLGEAIAYYYKNLKRH